MRQLADRNIWIILALAAAITVVNAAKPIHVDDWCTVINAREFAEHPGAPYAYDLDYCPYSTGAIYTLLPPVLPYAMALAPATGYPDTFSLKLMLFPFIALLLAGLTRLLNWVGSPYPLLMAAAFVLGPGVFPGMNTMLDVPALSLEISAIALCLSALRKESWLLAIAAGGVAGLGMETKYTAAAAIPVMILAGLCFGWVRYSIVAAVVAATVFVGTEAWLASVHGRSHFVTALGVRSGSTIQRMAQLAMPMFTHIGLMALVPATLILHSIRRSKTAWSLTGLALITPVALALVPAAWQVWNPAPSPYFARFALANLLFAVLGIFTLDAIRRCGIARNASAIEVFLLGWLILEIASMFVLSPFPAMRRCLGMSTALLILAGRVAARHPGIGPRLAAIIAAVSIGLGATYQILDWVEAEALRQSATRAVETARQHAPERRVWSYGWSELYFYSKEAGAKPFCWNGPHPEPGDTFVTWDAEMMLDLVPLFPAGGLELIETIPMTGQSRLILGSEYYAGSLPLTRRLGPVPCAKVYRVVGPLPLPTP